MRESAGADESDAKESRRGHKHRKCPRMTQEQQTYRHVKKGKHRSDRRHVEVSTQPHVDRWWWCAACVVNDRLQGCADKFKMG
jgi:hypothetical protein